MIRTDYLLDSIMRWRIESDTVMIHLLETKANSTQIQDLLEEYPDMIKIVVDIRRKILAGGGEMHADCEEALLDNGSDQDDLWGANWIPNNQTIEFESLINIRPRDGNRSMIIQSNDIRQQVESVTRDLLENI